MNTELETEKLKDLKGRMPFDQTSWVLIADENQSHCVCPLVNRDEGIGSSVMCYCSEGFAGKMFSVVFDRLVNDEVISSVLMGDASCRYKITF